LPESFPTDYRQCTPGLRRDREMPDKVTGSPPSSISVCSGRNLYMDSASSCISNEIVTSLLYIVVTA
jgi:hypothetical protein